MNDTMQGVERPHAPPQIDEELFKVTSGGNPVFEGAGLEIGSTSVELWYIWDMALFTSTDSLVYANFAAHPLYTVLQGGGTLNEALVEGYYASRPVKPTHKARLEYTIEVPTEGFFPAASEIGRARVIKQVVNGSPTVVGASFRQLIAGSGGAPTSLRHRVYLSSAYTSGSGSPAADHEHAGFITGAAFLTLCGNVPTPNRTVDVTFNITPF
jgi:hypothetical protein